jgi:hypothetical protein
MLQAGSLHLPTIAVNLELSMQETTKLFLLKTLHTLIWVFYNVVIFYMLFAAITGRIDKWLWICYGLVVLEGVILLCFRWTCPLTIVARKYTGDTTDNFDIFLPNWLARHTKMIYSCLVVVIIIITIFQLIRINS